MRPIPLAGLVGLVLTTPLQAQMVLGKVKVPEPSFQATNTEITPIEDTFLRENSPNDNNGNQGRMRIKGKISNSRVHRGLVRFDQQEIVNAVGSETLTSATLELAVDAASGWSGSGRYVGVHRVTQAWTELGATWNCADDTDRTNADLDCAPGDLWDMEASPASLPFVDVPTDSMLVLNGSAGQTVAVDVTADVQSFLSGSETNLGWIVAKRDEGSNGDVEVSSRSGTSPPRLTIVTASNEVPPIPDDPFIPSQQASNLTIPFPPDTSRVYVRDVFKIRFEEGATDAEKAAFFSAFGATVIGGSLFTGEYTIRVPDPGESFADYDSLRTALRAAPNIRWVVDVRLRGGIMQMLGSSRYPNDGPGFKRADYFADPNSSATWRYNAIRAPEGWSCATGRYAGEFQIRTAVIDRGFSALPADLQTQLVTQSAAPLPVQNDTAEAHGTTVAALMTSGGDDGIGIAGTVWNTALHLFEAGHDDDGLRRLLEDVFPSVSSAAIEVVVTSYSGRADISRESPADIDVTISRLELGIESVFAQHPDMIWVHAAGNDGLGAPSFMWQPLGWMFGAALLRVRATRPDNIVLVGGSKRGNEWWPGTTYISDVQMLVAPAKEMPVHPLLPDSGTSFAAPVVAGVAAQLLTMKPDLTIDQLTRYLMSGPSVSRFTDGGFNPKPDVQNAPISVKEVDAFGSLSLLSAEIEGTPVCGYPVSVRQDTIFFERDAFITAPEFSPDPSFEVIAGSPNMFHVSVAQGGREIAAADLGGSGVTVILDQTGTLVTTLPGIHHRQYLKTGWAEYRNAAVPFGTVLDVRVTPEGGTPGVWQDPMVRARTGDGAGLKTTGAISVSPLGDQVVFQGSVKFDPCNVFEKARLAIWQYDLQIGGDPTLTVDFECPDFFDAGSNFGIAWPPEGQTAAVFTGRVFNGPVFDEFTDVSFAPGGFSVSLSPVLYNPRYAFAGQVVISEEGFSGSGNCDRTIRRPAAGWGLLTPPGAISVPLNRCNAGGLVNQSSQVVAKAPSTN